MLVEPLIDFKNVSVYQKDREILSDVNLNLKRSEFIYIIGKVGSGKSSLLKTIYGELPVLQGQAEAVYYKLNDIKSKQIPFLRRKIGIVFQDFQLLTDRNVYDNLDFVLRATNWKKKKDIKERIEDVLDKVNLLGKMYALPHQLSGGEQQRVVIARALLNYPEVILADEPTGNLDPETSEQIMKTLRKICIMGRGIIMATHNYSIIRKFPSKTYKCEEGKLVEISMEEVQSIENLDEYTKIKEIKEPETELFEQQTDEIDIDKIM